MYYELGFPSGSEIKSPPAMQETQVQTMSQEDFLEEEMATHSCRGPAPVDPG